jgi:hypothetical protein
MEEIMQDLHMQCQYLKRLLGCLDLTAGWAALGTHIVCKTTKLKIEIRVLFLTQGSSSGSLISWTS